MAADPRSRATILGLPVDRKTMAEALDQIATWIGQDGHHLVITADASGLAQAQENAEYRALYAQASLVTADSVGVLWAARRYGSPIPERVSGVDLVERLCERSARNGHRIYFLGAAPGVAEEAAAKLVERYPGCRIVGTHHGYFRADEDATIAAEVAKANPDLLFVAMGIPRQELFVARYLASTGAKVGMGVGGSFDVFSGRAKRAPMVVQKLKLEWLWRTVLNPKKLSKAKLLPRFVWMVLRDNR